MTDDENHLYLTRKQQRYEKKLASQKDRSKYKKTDKLKREKLLEKEARERVAKKNLIEGRVLFITARGVTCDVEGKLINCLLRGSLKKEKGEAKNLITIGDFVLVEMTSQEEGAICFVEKRFSYLARASHFLKQKQQLIAANIDQVLITTSTFLPTLKPALVDRYIISTVKGKMEPIILLNKIDLLEKLPEEEKVFFQEFITTYRKLGYCVIALSTITGKGISELKKVMKDKASVFSGQSGTGKSSLINRICQVELKTKEIIKKTEKGAHTTTTAHLLPLDFGGWCIDTPGIRSFGVWDLKPEELSDYFPEIEEVGKKCKYPNCSHSHEPGCAVPDAIEEGKISPFRLQSYQKLLQESSKLSNSR